MATNARTAAERLGITQSAVHEMIRAGRLVASGRPALVEDDSITRVAYERRIEALRRIDDETEFAQKVASILHPETTVITRANGAPDPGALAAALQTPRGPGALHLVPADAWGMWGPTVLRAAAARTEWDSRRGCLTCWTRLTAKVHQTLEPRGNAATRTLLGAGCAVCQGAFVTAERQARTELARAAAAERDRRDQAAIAAFRATQRQAMADVREASARFAALDRQRKAMGLPPEGRQR